MTREIKVLPPELTDPIFDEGGRKLVLLEGESDVEVFENWFADELGDIDFYPAGGSNEVKSLLDAALAISARKQIFGVIDRDFRDDAEVQASLGDGQHLFILRRYSIENYLLEPAAVFEVALTFLGKPLRSSIEAIEEELLKLCRSLKSAMAANWILMGCGAKRLPDGQDPDGRAVFVQQIGAALRCSVEEADGLLADREVQIETVLNSLESAHTKISGKHLLYQTIKLIKSATKATLDKDHFRRLLRDSIKRASKVHPDLKDIVEVRVLCRSAPGSG